MKFVHVADPHIDSPLRGLDAHKGAPVEQLRGATRAAFAGVVSLAIEEAVDFVVIAGDLFDGPWQDVRTGVWTASELRRLDDAGIAVYLIRGNHDAASRVRQAIRLPACVREFSVEAPETFVDDDLGVALHGQGFATQEVSTDLAAAYPAARAGYVNVGVLHTSLAGDPHHDSYAPTSLATLVSKGYDYWALGHIHQRAILRESDPCVAYAGNTQGRHVRETGAKGCLVVQIDRGVPPQVTFHATDTVRWFHSTVELAAEDGREGLYDAARRALEECVSAAGGRTAAVRLSFRGATRAHAELCDAASIVETEAEIRSNIAPEVGAVWVEKVHLHLTPPIDVDALRRGNDLLAALLGTIDACASNDEALVELSSVLAPLQKHAKSLRDAGIELDSPENLRRWVRAAESRLAAQLWEGGA